MDDEVEAEEAVDRLLDDRPTEVAVVLGPGEVWIVEDPGDVGAGCMERPERVVVDGRSRTQRAIERTEHHLVDVDDVADDVAGGPLLARRLVRPVSRASTLAIKVSKRSESWLMRSAMSVMATIVARGTAVGLVPIGHRTGGRPPTCGRGPKRAGAGSFRRCRCNHGGGGPGRRSRRSAASSASPPRRAAASRMNRCRRAIRVKNAGL